MSRALYGSSSQRWGARMGDAKMMDMMAGALTDPFDADPHGRHRRERRGEVRLYARRIRTSSRWRAMRAQARDRRGPLQGARSCPSSSRARRARSCSTPTSTCASTPSLESMAKLKAVFHKDNGTVTAGNASGINDAAAAIVMMESRRRREAWPETDGAPRVVRPRRHRSDDHGPRPRVGGQARARKGRASRSATSTSSNPTRRSPPRRWACPRSSGSIPRR